jgi:tricarballylate dehydrogenase
MAKLDADVIVVGGGNAAFSAALAAQEQGASVLMLEAAPEDESGGNSRFTAGSVRVVYNGVDDIKALVPDLTEQEVATTDFGTYTQEQFFDDMARVTQNRADQDRRKIQVLGRADGRGGGRRPRSRQDAYRGRNQAGHQDPLRDPRAEPCL